MLLLAKFAGIAVLVWFFMTAKQHEQPAYKWAIVGLIGYWIAWWAVKLTVVAPLAGLFSKNGTAIFLITQIPAVCAVIAAIFIRKKMLADIASK